MTEKEDAPSLTGASKPWKAPAVWKTPTITTLAIDEVTNNMALLGTDAGGATPGFDGS